MRKFAAVLAVLLLAPLPAGSQDPKKAKKVEQVAGRAWRGWVEVRAISQAPPQGKGREEHTERVDFTLQSRVYKLFGKPHRVLLNLKQGKGEWKIETSLREPGAQAGDYKSTKGSGFGRLYPRVVSGRIDLATAACKVRVQCTPGILHVPVSFTGIDRGQMRNFRHVEKRKSDVQQFKMEGKLEADGTKLRGTHKFTDRSYRLAREVTVTWELQRIDPLVHGTVRDQSGHRLVGVLVKARTTNPARVKRKLPPLWKDGRTDRNGDFRIEAEPATWFLSVPAALHDSSEGALVIGEKIVADGAQVTAEKMPDVDIEVVTYVLAKIPERGLLQSRFDGDVGSFLSYIEARHGARALERARRP